MVKLEAGQVRITMVWDMPKAQRERCEAFGYIARIDWRYAGQWVRTQAELADYIANGPRIAPAREGGNAVSEATEGSVRS